MTNKTRIRKVFHFLWFLQFYSFKMFKHSTALYVRRLSRRLSNRNGKRTCGPRAEPKTTCGGAGLGRDFVNPHWGGPRGTRLVRYGLFAVWAQEDRGLTYCPAASSLLISLPPEKEKREIAWLREWERRVGTEWKGAPATARSSDTLISGCQLHRSSLHVPERSSCFKLSKNSVSTVNQDPSPAKASSATVTTCISQVMKDRFYLCSY